MDTELLIPQAVYEAMLAHAQFEAPNECVGMLAGNKDGQVVEHFPLVNALADPRRFLTEGRSQLQAERRCRELGLHILAVYHSHPTSPPVPSRTDTDPEENLWVGQPVASVIISLLHTPPEVRVWWLESNAYRPARWRIDPGAPPGTAALATTLRTDGPL